MKEIVIRIEDELFEQCKTTELTEENEGFDFHIIKTVANGTPLEEELEKIKAEIYRHHNITCNLKCATCFLEYNCELRRKIDLLEDLAIIDKHIAELKGENK